MSRVLKSPSLKLEEAASAPESVESHDKPRKPNAVRSSIASRKKR